MMPDKIAQLLSATERLAGLLRDPQPGLLTWLDAVNKLRNEIGLQN